MLKKIFIILVLLFSFGTGFIAKASELEIIKELNLGKEKLSNVNLLEKISTAAITDVPSFSYTVHAEGAILIKDNISKIMFKKNIHQRFFPASTTKIMTALLAVENCDLNEVVTVSKTALDSVPAGSTRAGVEVGDILTVKQLLYGMLLPSGNDCAAVLAEHIAGSQEKFALMMNKKAAELGTEQTNFVNPHGFFSPNHYTTPYDFAIICQEAFKQRQIRNTISTRITKVIYKNKNGQKVVKTWVNSNSQLKDANRFTGLVGGKTGYTSEAGHTLCTLGHYKGHDYIVVIFKDGAHERYKDTKSLLLKAFKLCDASN
ncbi:serine hydrolase [Bacillota bacterium LX-D]|nr:serine hydrolase [Bacillota bacterium LX-D]